VSLGPSVQSGCAPLSVRAGKVYETPVEATRALMQVERLPHHIWEPACGPGAIVKVLRVAGHTVWATDLNDHGCPESQPGVDFLLERQSRIDVEAIITNPPYELANVFVSHALKLCPRVFMLLRLAFLEGLSRQPLIDIPSFKGVHVFRNRLPMMHREGYDGPKVKTSAVAFAWFVWDRAHEGPATINRITWQKSQ